MSLEWWKKSVIYHVYLPAFKDGNGDGIGDFIGLISKFDYFSELKISSLLLSPFYPSPMKDNGYDISNYTDVDSTFGSLQGFELMMQKAKENDLNIIIDFVANHTSSLHPWFLKSVERIEPYTDFFIWVDGKPENTGNKLMPPNNWLSVFNGSAWTWNDKRKQFYFHQFLPEQPDLNYRNPHVRIEMKKVLIFWLEKGVDGFRIDAASHLFEDERLQDEPKAKQSTAKPGEHGYLNHIYTKGQKETFELLEEWRTVLDDYFKKTKKPKIMLIEGMEEVDELMLYYGESPKILAEIPMNFQFYKVKSSSTGLELKNIIKMWLNHMPKGKYPNWVMSSHDFPRVLSRVGSNLAASLVMIQMLLPGVPIWYYGDELGMDNGDINVLDMKDSFALRTVPTNSRDPMRTPMQWNGSTNAGFTESTAPWLPVNKDYKTKNVEMQMYEPFSYLENFRKLLKIREQASILLGPFKYILVDENVFSFIRPLTYGMSYIVVVNMGPKTSLVDLTETQQPLPQYANLELTNPEYYGETIATFGMSNLSTSSEPGSSDRNDAAIKVPLNSVYLQKHQGMVLSFQYQDMPSANLNS